MRGFTVTVCVVLLTLVIALWAPRAHATDVTDPGSGDSEYAQDYQTVRKVGLALAVVGFLLGISRLGMSEFPAERKRAESLIALTAVVFLALAGDRILMRGVASWFSIPIASLPEFWQ